MGARSNAHPCRGRFTLAPHRSPLAARRDSGRAAAIGLNVSHFGDRFGVAVAGDIEPGVDIERIRARRNLAGVVRRLVSPVERAGVTAAPAPPDAFCGGHPERPPPG